MKSQQKKELVLSKLLDDRELSSNEVYSKVEKEISYATTKRVLVELVKQGLVKKTGVGKSTKYSLSSSHKVLKNINLKEYYSKEIDDRVIEKRFNFNLLYRLLPEISLFTDLELNQLTALQAEFKRKVHRLEEFEFQKEMERLAIDLSWKSSEIEGNTYSLLETEQLLKEKITAAGKTKDEAIMLLNHKEAIDFINKEADYFENLSISKIEEVHSILVKELPIKRNIRQRTVGISGTNYTPLDNEFQIREALEVSCKVINNKENVFEKALLALALLSYIQAFNDGNKRTARILSNAILLSQNHCPLSFRTVSSIDYKKSMLLFYEQNNISAIKRIFIEQFEFAVNTYFLE